ncbi:hypothetical protein I6E84_10530 [Psychrobacter sp. SCQQ22]|uniref:hypothetical protein n=1 Tax=Psychrobacter sp. SCQQ22 TaxID=2792059 RepID=UPI0018CEAB80|nr:hypothetical protein [Psychrobacter sp. SCQQ22]MBH0086652.1 hypothetical protein [Psychrobacter sp. SCQQ22]
MSYLFKDFLRLEDVGEYLNQYGYSYDPEEEGGYCRLKNTILDLYHENKLNVVFYYDDFALIKTLRFSKDLSVEEVKDERFEHYISGYFHALEVKSVIEHECNLNIIRTSYSYYHLYDKEQLPISDNEYKVEAGRKFTSIEFGDNEIPSVIEFSDLRFPKADLDKLFNEKNSELKSVKDELADVKAQNAKLIADKEESKATGSFMMGTPTVEHGKPKSKTNEQQAEALAAAKAQIIDLENQLAQAKAELADKPAHDNTGQNHLYNWQAMDKNQYPPELHLAIEIWKEYYQADVVEHITQFDSGRFNRISTKLNLSKGNLKDRVRTLLTPLNSKTRSPELLSSLEVINIIHNDKLEQD